MTGKIRILHIIKTLGLGGAEVNLLNLVRATDFNRFELHVAYSSGGQLEGKFKNADVKLFKFANKDHKIKSLASLGVILRLANYLKRNHIQIVHTHNLSAQIWGAAAAKIAGCKIVEHVHDYRYLDPEDFARRRGGIINQFKYIHQFKNVSDRVVVLTRQNKDFLTKERIYPLERIREYQNGIPIKYGINEHRINGGGIKLGDERQVTGNQPKNEPKEKLCAKFGLRPDALIIFTAIRLAPEKNVDLILRIAPEIIFQLPNAVFLIAGDGPLFQVIEETIKKKGLASNIKLIGYHPEIQLLLRGSDIFVLPSFLELHSIAVLEAMSMKVPVVISKDVGCNSEFIEDWKNGVLLDPFKDEGWAAAIVQLLKDPHLRSLIGNNGYQTCLKKFNIDDAAQRFEELYVELARL